MTGSQFIEVIVKLMQRDGKVIFTDSEIIQYIRNNYSLMIKLTA